MRLYKTIATGALVALTGLASHADPLQVRSMAAACASCHGTKGVALDGMDSLAGKPKSELQKKLMDYKNGSRAATVMHQLAKGYTDEQIDQLATYFSTLKP